MKLVSCEHEGWVDSEAKKLLDAAIDRLKPSVDEKAYELAEWEFHEIL